MLSLEHAPWGNSSEEESQELSRFLVRNVYLVSLCECGTVFVFPWQGWTERSSCILDLYSIFVWGFYVPGWELRMAFVQMSSNVAFKNQVYGPLLQEFSKAGASDQIMWVYWSFSLVLRIRIGSNIGKVGFSWWLHTWPRFWTCLNYGYSFAYILQAMEYWIREKKTVSLLFVSSGKRMQ